MKAFKFILCIGLAIFLLGCSTKKIYQSDLVARTSIAQINSLNKQLRSYNVRVFQSSKFMTMVLPNRSFFNANSANFTDDAYHALDLIFSLSGCYEKSVVSVMGFTKSTATDNLDKTLAAERANRVVQYLWKQGIDANFMYADGSVIPLITVDKKFLTDCVVISFCKL